MPQGENKERSNEDLDRFLKKAYESTKMGRIVDSILNWSVRKSNPKEEFISSAEVIAAIISVILMIVAMIEYSLSASFGSGKKRGTVRYPNKAVIGKAPGEDLLAISNFLFSPTTVQQTFKPLVADWRYEYFEALKDGCKWKARWISTRYRCAFVWAMSLSKVFSFLKQLRSVSK